MAKRKKGKAKGVGMMTGITIMVLCVLVILVFFIAPQAYLYNDGETETADYREVLDGDYEDFRTHYHLTMIGAVIGIVLGACITLSLFLNEIEAVTSDTSRWINFVSLNLTFIPAMLLIYVSTIHVSYLMNTIRAFFESKGKLFFWSPAMTVILGLALTLLYIGISGSRKELVHIKFEAFKRIKGGEKGVKP